MQQASGRVTSHSAWSRFRSACLAPRAANHQFNLLHKTDHSRIRQVTYCQAEDKPIARTEP